MPDPGVLTAGEARNALGSDVEIVVRPKPRSRDQARLRIVGERRRG